MAERPTRRNMAREIPEGSACAWAASPEVRPIGVRTTVVRAARAATEEGQRECRAKIDDNSGTAPIMGLASGLGGGAQGV
jgi:hypothetical protein